MQTPRRHLRRRRGHKGETGGAPKLIGVLMLILTAVRNDAGMAARGSSAELDHAGATGTIYRPRKQQLTGREEREHRQSQLERHRLTRRVCTAAAEKEVRASGARLESARRATRASHAQSHTTGRSSRNAADANGRTRPRLRRLLAKHLGVQGMHCSRSHDGERLPKEAPSRRRGSSKSNVQQNHQHLTINIYSGVRKGRQEEKRKR